MFYSNLFLIVLITCFSCFFVNGWSLANTLKHLSLKLNSDPDEYISTSKLIISKGYPAEEHNVMTDDGYILTMHRIPSGRSSSKSVYDTVRPVAFLQHGLLDASSSWVMNFQDQSLGFILADNGFDVWMGNVRGNSYSLKHIKYNISQPEFWDFSWDEMSKYDLPAMLNYVLKTTNQDQLFYIGHSQGTLMAFANLGLNSDLVSKIKLFIALAPVATVGHLKSPIRYLADIGVATDQEIWYALFGKKDFLPSDVLIRWFGDKLCNEVATNKLVCENILFAFCGPSVNLNQTRISVYLTHDPAGTSVKNLAHFAQMFISKKFQMYDYGSSKQNSAHYNQTKPPLYTLKNIKTPVALYWSKKDWLATPADVEYIRNNLPNIVGDLEIFDYDHLDFLWAQDANFFVYDKMLELMKSYL